jgi:hypothetical protein
MLPAEHANHSAATASAEPSLIEGWAQITEKDQEWVRRGVLPKEIIQYDLQIGQMLPEAREIMASHDKATARAWSEKMHGLIEARNRPIAAAQAKWAAMSSVEAGDANTHRPDPCLSPMGKNICNTGTSAGSSVNYSAGPGGIGASMGGLIIGPGGIGIGQ